MLITKEKALLIVSRETELYDYINSSFNYGLCDAFKKILNEYSYNYLRYFKPAKAFYTAAFWYRLDADGNRQRKIKIIEICGLFRSHLDCKFEKGYFYNICTGEVTNELTKNKKVCLYNVNNYIRICEAEDIKKVSLLKYQLLKIKNKWQQQKQKQ